MTIARHLVIALACVGALSGPVAAQDPLSEAKRLYDSASYSEALSSLDAIAATADVVEVEKYRALCQLALGKSKEAEQSLERLAMARPLFTLDADASPRLVALFNGVRRRVMPEASKLAYQRARAAFDSGDMANANKGFKEVIDLAAMAPPDQAAVMGELKMLASGFLRLTEAPAPKPDTESMPLQAMTPPQPSAASAAPPAAAESTPAPAPEQATAPNQAVTRDVPAPTGRAAASAPRLAASPGPGTTYDASDASVTPPVAIDRVTPAWSRPLTLRNFAFQGLLDIVVNEQGTVIAAAMLKSVHVSYDSILMTAARKWKFRPATLEGRPVRYRLTYPITVEAEVRH